MNGVGSPKLLFENLDITPIQPTLWKDLHIDGPGRPVEYQPEFSFVKCQYTNAGPDRCL